MSHDAGETNDHPGRDALRHPGKPGAAAERIRKDAEGQYGAATTRPNKDGLTSANPVVLSKDGDATSGNGHGRDRDGSKTAQE